MTGDGEFVRLTPFEQVVGTALGRAVSRPLPPVSRTARQALDGAVFAAMRPGRTTYVQFSGGRDSSAVLAVATQIARKHGFEDPVPITECHPDLPETDEEKWQRLVIDALGLKEWQRLTIHGETDLLGEVCREGLRRHGLIWPPTAQSKSLLLAEARGGVVLTGEGGDEVFGPRRMTTLRSAMPWRRPNLPSVRAGVVAVAPRSVRRRKLETRLLAADSTPWLRPHMRERMVREQSDLMSTEPLAWGRSVWWLTSRRAPEVILHNYATLAAEFQVTLAHPLLDEGFLAALAREGGLLGLTSRTAAMEHLFGDVLPRELIHRQQKSRFNRAFMGRPTREFASGWDGSGVDSANVDATILRECWLSDEPPALSMTLLHVAWLASQGLTTMGEP